MRFFRARSIEFFLLENKEAFQERMDDDLDVKGAFDTVGDLVSRIDIRNLTSKEASGVITALRDIDEVLQVVF
jgi:cysteinyl-tRNA synthetase